MIGRAAQGRPWLIRQIEHFLTTGHRLPDPGIDEVRDVVLGHLHALHQFYGAKTGVRVARKHIKWFVSGRPNEDCFWHAVNKTVDCDHQLRLVADFFASGQLHPGAPLAA